MKKTALNFHQNTVQIVLCIFYLIIFLGGFHLVDASDNMTLSSNINHQKIRERMDANVHTLQYLKGKDITVFLGDTGSGKSTLINVLSQIPLGVNSFGHIIQQSDDIGMMIKSGGKSITKNIQYVNVEGLGILCDLPGFQDTEGALDDMMNASLVHGLLSHARSVKSVFVTTSSELETLRGAAFKKIFHAMDMFSDPSIHHKSSLLVMNKVDFDQEETLISTMQNMIQDDPKKQTLFEIFLTQKKIITLSRARFDDTAGFFAFLRQKLMDPLRTLSYQPVPQKKLTIAMTFNEQTSGIIGEFFYHELALVLSKNHHILQKNYEESIRIFMHFLSLQESLTFLQPLGEEQYQRAFSKFMTSFMKEHELVQQKMVAEKMKRDIECAQKKQLEAEENQKKDQEKIQKALQKMAELENIKNQAIETTCKMRQEIERTQRNESITKAQKEEALKRIAQAEENKRKAEEETKKYQSIVQQLQNAQQQSLLKLKALETEQHQAQANLQQMEQQIQERYASLISRKEREVSSLRYELEQLRDNQGEISRLRNTISRLQSELSRKDDEIRSLRSQQQSRRNVRVMYCDDDDDDDYGHHGYLPVQTSFGIGFMRY